MYETKYQRASNVEDAAKMLAATDDGKFISGGQTLIPTMKQRLAAPSDLIDVRNIDAMKGIAVDGSNVSIGAAATHAEVANSNDVHKACPALCDLAGMIGDPHVRHMGTIGGSIANNDPAADYPAAMIALNAQITTSKRTIGADDFFTDLFETALEEDEIVTSITFQAPSKAAYAKFPNPASRYAMAGVFVAQVEDGAARVGVTGAGSSGVFRHGEMEAALSKDWSEAAIKNCKVDEAAMLSDLHGNAAYRANLVKVMAKRAVAAAG